MLLVLIVGMLWITASTASAAGWLEPKDISASNEVVDGRPEIAVDPAGNAVAVWERHVGGEEIVEATERPAGGEWSEPEVLSLPGEEGNQSRVAIDASGNAIAVWITEEGSTDFVVRSAARPPDGEWSEPEDVSDLISEAVTPQLAFDAASGAVAVWTAFEAGDRILQGAVRSASGEWLEPDDISDAGENVSPLPQGAPDVAIDGSGTAIAVWTLEGSDNIVQAAVRPSGGEWSAPEDLSDAGGDAGEPGVAMNEAGEAVTVWTRSNGSDAIVQAAVRPSGGEWSEADDLSATGQDAGEGDVGIDEAGEAVAVWTRSNGSDAIVQAAVRPSGGEWSEADDLSATGRSAFSPVVATNDALGAVAAWYRSDGTNLRVQAAVRTAGDWSKPDDLSAAGEGAAFPEVALDAAGNAFAVFGRDGDDGPFVQATGYDFSAPRLDDLRIPTAGTVGEPVSFAVSPFDVFPLAGTSWTFGDGSQAGGNAVSHTYAAPGAYPVIVSAVDAGGNVSTQVGAIAVAPRPTKPPPPRRQIALTLRIEKESLQKLMRTGTLRVATGVNEAASVALSGRAKFKVRRARGGTRTKLVPAFAPKTVRFAAAAEEKVTLALSERGRKALRSLSKVRILIAGEARSDGGTAKKKAAKTLR
jgi:hypothetical protein